MKKITVFVLVVVLVMGVSTLSFAVSGNELVTSAEKAQALKNPKVKEAIEIGKEVAKKVVIGTISAVINGKRALKNVKSAAELIKALK